MPRWVAALRLLGVGFFVGVCIIAGIVTGLWIDNKLGTKPVFIVAGILLGIFIAFYGIYQMLLPLLKNSRGEDNN